VPEAAWSKARIVLDRSNTVTLGSNPTRGTDLYLLTYLLTPWCRILFEKLIVNIRFFFVLYCSV
jgi:hypothetical protein